MQKISFNSIIRKQPPKSVFIEAIWKSRHRHLSISIVIGIGIDIGIAKNLFLSSDFSLKNRILMFFLVLSYHLSTTLLQVLISLQFPIRSSRGVHWCSRKRQFEVSEASIHCCFERITTPKISACFAYFPAKHPGWSSF